MGTAVDNLRIQRLVIVLPVVGIPQHSEATVVDASPHGLEHAVLALIQSVVFILGRHVVKLSRMLSKTSFAIIAFDGLLAIEARLLRRIFAVVSVFSTVSVFHAS